VLKMKIYELLGGRAMIGIIFIKKNAKNLSEHNANRLKFLNSLSLPKKTLKKKWFHSVMTSMATFTNFVVSQNSKTKSG